ncbi:hypothetical protein AMECASPLE_038705 [Ameca splendens]|uniref:Uncharacterized protein n=1 Tax=Ameca splendens TaxID=208324 RepID=A0ABV0YKL0_9TELE
MVSFPFYCPTEHSGVKSQRKQDFTLFVCGSTFTGLSHLGLFCQLFSDLEQDGFSKNPFFHGIIAEVPEQHRTKEGENNWSLMAELIQFCQGGEEEGRFEGVLSPLKCLDH